jgi:hypothetical protein
MLTLVLSRIVVPRFWLGLALGAVILRASGTWTGFVFLPLLPRLPVHLLLLSLLSPAPSSSGIIVWVICVAPVFHP